MQSRGSLLSAFRNGRPCIVFGALAGYERMDRADARNMAELYKLKLAHETMRVAVCGVMEDIMRNVDDGMPPSNSFFFCLRCHDMCCS
jgi:hypothetical protein